MPFFHYLQPWNQTKEVVHVLWKVWCLGSSAHQRMDVPTPHWLSIVFVDHIAIHVKSNQSLQVVLWIETPTIHHDDDELIVSVSSSNSQCAFLTFENGCGLICGNLWSTYWGFIFAISSLEGVPRILIISTSWSMPLSPGNKGWPNKNSPMTHPADQISMLVV